MSTRSFTLIELIVVIMILMVLVTLATPQFFMIIERARSTEGIQILGLLRSSVLRYFTQYANTTDNLTHYDIDFDSKYFDKDSIVLTPYITNWTRNKTIASIHRNNFRRPDNVANYTLYIDTDGDLWCDSEDFDFTCNKLNLPVSH